MGCIQLIQLLLLSLDDCDHKGHLGLQLLDAVAHLDDAKLSPLLAAQRVLVLLGGCGKATLRLVVHGSCERPPTVRVLVMDGSCKRPPK
eukprot:935034-Karenia_brevis.AAC.1